MAFCIRPVQEKDLQVVSEIACESFRETYGWYNPPERMEPYLAKHFNVEALAAEAAEEGSTMWVILDVEKVAGFCVVSQSALPPELEGSKAVEVRRLYISKEYHGKGPASQLLAHVEREAYQAGFEKVWLGVWEQNSRAIVFYVKNGYMRVGELIFMFGEDAQEDALMVKDLIPEEQE